MEVLLNCGVLYNAVSYSARVAQRSALLQLVTDKLDGKL